MHRNPVLYHQPESKLHHRCYMPFYHYLKKQPCGNDTIGGILQKIETCIPLAVTEESFSLFLSACKEPKSERTRNFLESSKADFLLMVHHAAKDDLQWEALTILCETLRQRNLK